MLRPRTQSCTSRGASAITGTRRPTEARIGRAFAAGPTERYAFPCLQSKQCAPSSADPRALQRADARQLRQPAEHGKMGGIEPAGLVADFAEGGLHDLFGLDGVAQDAEGQGAEAQRVAWGKAQQRANGPPGH